MTQCRRRVPSLAPALHPSPLSRQTQWRSVFSLFHLSDCQYMSTSLHLVPPQFFANHTIPPFVDSSLIVPFDHCLAISLRRCPSRITGCMPSPGFSNYRNPSVCLSLSLSLNCAQCIRTRLAFPPQSDPESKYIHGAHLESQLLLLFSFVAL